MATALSLSVSIKALDKLTAPFKKMTSAVSSFGRSALTVFAKVDRRARKLNQSLNKITKRFGGIAAIAGGLTIGAAVASGADAFVSLEKNISAASAKFGIFDRTTEQFKSIRNAAIEVGATTEFTSGQAAEGLNFLAMAGFSAKQSIAALPGVIDLATAAQIELGSATDIATDTLGAFGLMTEDTVQLGKNLSRVNNVLAKTTTATNTSMEALFESVAKGGASFTSAGQSLETYSALAGRMAASGIKGSVSGTALKASITRLAKGVPAVKNTLSKLGVSISDSSGNMRNMIDIIADVEKATKSMGNTQRLATVSTIFGERALAGISSIMNEGAAEAKRLEKTLVGVNDVSGDMARFMRSGLSGVLAGMKSAFESIAIAIGDTFAPEIDATIKKLTDIARGAKSWVVENKGLIKTIFSIIKGLVKLLLFFKAFIVLLSIGTAGIASYNIVLGVMGALSGTASVAIGKSSIAMKAYALTLKIAGIATKIFGGITKATFLPITIILGVIILIVRSFMRNWEMVKKSFKDGGILGGLKAIGKVLLDVVLFPVQKLLGLLSKIPGVGSKIPGVGSKISPAFEGVKGLRERMGLKVEDDTKKESLNADASIEKVRTERSEKTINNKLGIDINDKSGLAAVVANTGNIPINITKTVGQ